MGESRGEPTVATRAMGVGPSARECFGPRARSWRGMRAVPTLAGARSALDSPGRPHQLIEAAREEERPPRIEPTCPPNGSRGPRREWNTGMLTRTFPHLGEQSKWPGSAGEAWPRRVRASTPLSPSQGSKQAMKASRVPIAISVSPPTATLPPKDPPMQTSPSPAEMDSP